MSLLMKALEKAAKDRDEARAEPVAPTPAAQSSQPASFSPSGPVGGSPAAPRSELSLEPIASATEPSSPPPSTRPEPPSHPAAPAAPLRTGRAAAGASREQARAATVVQAAGTSSAGGAIAKIMSRPVWLIGILAVLIGIGYGTYVYLQLFHPALFLSKPPIAPKTPPPSPIGQAPAPSPAPVAGAGTGTETMAGTVVQGTVPAAPGAPEAPATPGTPIASAPAAAQPGPQDFGPAPPPAPAPAPAPPRAPEKSVAEAPPPPPPPAPRDTIKVSRGSTVTAVSPLLTNAYAALQSDRRDDAQRTYEQLLRAEPRNIDALLGLAAIAAAEGRSDEATRRYLQILELDPRHTLAQSGLIGLLGRADPVSAESRLKQLIAREPSAFLHFTLGNLYADQSQWAAAQQAYFQAHHLEPNNPDYAYNLAIGLEHVNQGKLALGYYRRAVDLAGTTGRARFDVAQAQQRISRLASQVE